MDDAALVGRLQHVAERGENPADPLRREPAPLLEQPFEKPAAHVLHDQEHAGRVVRRPAVELDGIRMLKATQDLDFAAKARAHRGVGGARFFENFDHDLAADLAAAVDLAGDVDPANAAFAQKAVDAEAIEKGSADHCRSCPDNRGGKLPPQVYVMFGW